MFTEKATWVPANATVIPVVPNLQTSSPRHLWLNYGVYVGSLTPRTNGSGVELNFYKLK